MLIKYWGKKDEHVDECPMGGEHDWETVEMGKSSECGSKYLPSIGIVTWPLTNRICMKCHNKITGLDDFRARKLKAKQLWEEGCKK